MSIFSHKGCRVNTAIPSPLLRRPLHPGAAPLIAAIGLLLALVVPWSGAIAGTGSQGGAPSAMPLEAASTERGGPVHDFYARRGFRPFWLAGDGTPTEAAEALLEWIGEAGRHALPVARYRQAELLRRTAEAASAPDPRARAEQELALTRLFLAYARDLTSGALEPGRINPLMAVEPPRPDPGELLTRLAEADDLPAFLASLAPRSDTYRRLLDLYAELRRIVAAGGWGEPVPPGPSLRPGDVGPRVLALRQRLLALGDLSSSEYVASAQVMTDAPAADTDPAVFDLALEAAVKRFQARHGLNTDGVVGRLTLAALNTTAAERRRQVAANLERLRWLNRDPGWRYIVVNTAAFTMTVYEGDTPVFTTRTVVGRPEPRYQTPEFVDRLEFMVVNPKWNVPRSIAVREILPELRENPNYLAENDMYLVGADLPAQMIDWTLVTPETFPGRIVQAPGPRNALGAVKFLFPNRFSIYMHDTPAKKLFRYDRRTFSHGCIRLQDPFDFAYYLLGLEGYEDPAATFARLRAAEGEKWLRLSEPIPVQVTYRSAWVDDTGVWNFRADVYGRDRQVWAALAAVGLDADTAP